LVVVSVSVTVPSGAEVVLVDRVVAALLVMTVEVDFTTVLVTVVFVAELEVSVAETVSFNETVG
jgi:hypothetical protein